jgi:hypothetical protein
VSEFSTPMVFEAQPTPQVRVRMVPNMQEAQAVLRGIERAAMRRPGIKCARLLRVKPDFFAALQAECLGLTAADTEAAQRDKTHLENWIGHYGVTVQTRIDKMLRKGTLDPAEWPRLHALTQAFAPTLEMKINGVAPAFRITKKRISSTASRTTPITCKHAFTYRCSLIRWPRSSSVEKRFILHKARSISSTRVSFTRRETKARAYATT